VPNYFSCPLFLIRDFLHTLPPYYVASASRFAFVFASNDRVCIPLSSSPPTNFAVGLQYMFYPLNSSVKNKGPMCSCGYISRQAAINGRNRCILAGLVCVIIGSIMYPILAKNLVNCLLGCQSSYPASYYTGGGAYQGCAVTCATDAYTWLLIAYALWVSSAIAITNSATSRSRVKLIFPDSRSRRPSALES
jgi:hypothetical protein